MSVTVRDIAAKAGVSITTVSRVLNESANVDPETRERVLNIMRREGYVRRERVKRERPTRNVCVVLSDSTKRSVHSHPTVYTILSGLTGRLGELGIGNTLHMLGDTPESASKLLSGQADAFVFIRTRKEQEDITIPKLLSARPNTPVMLVNRRIEDKRVSYVNIDDFAAEAHAAEYLIRQGHRRIALVNGDETLRNSILRRDGFLYAMKKHKLDVPPELMISGEYSEEFGKEAARRLAELKGDLTPDAIMTTSDVIALGVEKTLLKLGISIPGDISLIGFGDVELASYISPSLTTVRIPAREMGLQAANAINYLLGSPSIQNIKIVMKSELCVRESTAPLRRNVFSDKGEVK